MELTPQLLTDEIDFRIAVRGYDRHEVDDFLERVAVAVGQLQAQLSKAVARARSAEATIAELEANGDAKKSASAKSPTVPPVQGDLKEKPEPAAAAQAPGIGEKSSPEPAAAVSTPKAPPSAPVPVISTDAELNDELRRTLVLAQRTADLAIREAHEEARNIVRQADDEARRNREAAEAAHATAREEARARLVGEIRELEATRESMRSDTVVLERYLGTERARVRETIQVLRRLVDDPNSFKVDPTPELSDATVPVEDTDAAESEPTGSGPTESESTTSADDAVDAGVTETTDESAVSDGVVPAAETIVEEVDPGENHEDAQSEDAQAASEEPMPGDGQEAATDQERPKSDSERLGELFAPSSPAKDWRSEGPERGDQGPHTQPVAAARFEEESDEAFLAELRRAMNEDEPLGPTEN